MLELEKMEKLASECVGAAKKAWEANFKNCWNSGDHNREAIGRIATEMMSYYLRPENEGEVRKRY